MVEVEEKRETGASLIFIGLALWVVGFLVVFFLPSGMKFGRETTFYAIIAALFGLGLILLIAGYIKGKKAGTEE